MIESHCLRVPRGSCGSLEGIADAIESRVDGAVLRWYVSRVTADTVDVEVTVASEALPRVERSIRAAAPHDVLVSIVPTGVGCAVGGYAGDAGPATKLLARTVDYLVTNPNAVNASDFAAIPSNLLYTEGSILDLFCMRELTLLLPTANRLAIVIERAEETAVAHVVNVANAVHTTHGVAITEIVVTEEPVGTRSIRTESGSYTGQLDNPAALLSACERALASGADALAIATLVRDVDPEDYVAHLSGNLPNPIGGAEAVVSHLVSRTLRVPSAHAPLLNHQRPLESPTPVDPRSGGEAASTSGLASVLMGLHRAPQFDPAYRRHVRDVVTPEDVVAVVTPASAVGSPAVLASDSAGVPIIAVGESTVLAVTTSVLGLQHVVNVRNYVEAAGAALALRAGISLESLRRPVSSVAVIGANDRRPDDAAAVAAGAHALAE